MATTHHGHYIPFSERTEHDDRAVRFAKPCGGIDNCSDCKIESDEWQATYLHEENNVLPFAPKEGVEASKLRHPSTLKVEPNEDVKYIPHVYSSKEGDHFLAWQYHDLLRWLTDNEKLPAGLKEYEIRGDLRARVSDGRWIVEGHFAQYSDRDWIIPGFETMWIIVGDGRLHLVTDKLFRQTYEPVRIFENVSPNTVRSTMGFKPADDAVNHPSYYGGADNPYEVIKVIEAWDLDFHLGTAVKYIPRAGKKDPELEIQDLEKSVFYINRKIELLREKVKKNG